ncbi:MAG: ribonuclease J [Bacilli bacterium]|nr:ribonuclease J [Bacilli bacterium]
MADRIKICALGGLDEKGRDCYIVEINDDLFVLDCGISFPDKSLPGIDCIIPNPDYVIKNKNRLKAYLITHGHDESMSAVKYFVEKAPAPIYCSFDTMVAMQGQAKNHHLNPNFDFKVVKPSDKVMIAGHEVRFFQVPHNARNSSGVALWTDRGWIIYTSDFIVDFSVNEPGYYLDMAALEEIATKKTFVLMGESKAVTRSGYCSPKHKSKPFMESHFKYDNKRIFISTTWQNVYRINEILKLCRTYKKKIYPYNEYARMILREYTKSDPDIFHGLEILNSEDLLRVSEQDLVILILGQGKEIYKEIIKLANNENLDRRIRLNSNDCFIVANIPLQTQETICTRSVDSLYRTGCQVVWIKGKDVTSMHAQKDDLKFMLSVLRPAYYLPVRGNFVNMMANARLALAMEIGLTHMNVFILDNGSQLIFDETSRPSIIAPERAGIEISPVLVDGDGYTRRDDSIINERVRMSEDGVVVIASSVSLSKKEIVAGPDCQMRGFVFVKEAEPLLKTVSGIYIEEVNNALKADKFDIETITANVQERSRKFIKRENGREPCILPIIQILE